MRFVVVYSSIVEEEGEIFVDAFYFGGIVDDRDEADKLARHITNDDTIEGVIVPKIFPIEYNHRLDEVLHKASKYFNQLASEMYEIEDVSTKSKSRELAAV
jgi:cell division protein YceG involved in septum cleavage